jgi:hypothetical protein
MEEATTPTPFLLNDAVVQVVEEQLRWHRLRIPNNIK